MNVHLKSAEKMLKDISKEGFLLPDDYPDDVKLSILEGYIKRVRAVLRQLERAKNQIKREMTKKKMSKFVKVVDKIGGVR